MLTLPWNNPVLPGFIVFEGLDGAGTTTQARLLHEFLRETDGSEEKTPVLTCEPTDRPTGRLIRTLLAADEHVEAWTLALLFAADRNEHLKDPIRGIEAALGNGQIVISDRYLFSSLAYQGSFADFTEVERLNGAFPLPEYLLFIDTPLHTAEKRMSSRAVRDRLEQSTVQERVEGRYRAVIDEFEERVPAMKVHRFDGSAAPGEISRQITTLFRR
ncbi:MAG: dTMP kinase [Alkalispirochaeta sp.]